jgi:parallel beta-helix repeat protein
MMRRREAGKLLLAYAASVSVPRIGRTQTCGSDVYDETPAEAAAKVKIVDRTRCPGDWRRYGADPTGNGDSTAAIQAACNSNPVAFDDAGGTYVVSAPIDVPSNVTLRGSADGATRVTCSDGGISVFRAVGASGVIIERIRIGVSAASDKAHTGAVEFRSSTLCACKNCEITGCNWCGVYIVDSTHCTVDHCYFHDFQGSVHDSSNIAIYNQSHHNSVTNNRCFGGSWHGIMIQDPYNNSLPGNNLIANNAVGQHQAYGLLVYVPASGDTFNRVVGNTVENVQGSALNGESGSGIYVVGKGAGGTEILNNTVRNCCVQTHGRSLAPAGIGINGIQAAAAPVSVSGNTVFDMPAHDAILIVSSQGPVTVSGNSATLPRGNSATPIHLDASSNVTVSGNTASRDPDTVGRCIFVHANAIAISGIAVVDNICNGSHYVQIEFLPAGGGSIADVVCRNNTCRGPGTNANCIRLAGVGNADAAGNQCLPAN